MGALSFPTAQARQAAQHSPADVIAAEDPTPAPGPTMVEALSRFLPSDAGGIEFLWNPGEGYQPVPTPLETPPTTEPLSPSAEAMKNSGPGQSLHVDNQAAGPFGAEVVEAAPATKPRVTDTLRQTLLAERDRLASLFAAKRVSGG